MIPSRPTLFFALTFALSAPFWILGAVVERQFLPGLPASALMVLAPAVAACILVFQTEGKTSTWSFLRQVLDWRRITPWAWVAAVCTMPLVFTLSGLWLVATGQDLPAVEIRFAEIGVLFVLFLLAATAEEIGWTGYASQPLYQAKGLVVAGAILGCVAVLWHIIPLIQAGRSWDWIAWWALGTFARRFVILALYLRGGGSVFAASLFHAMNNVSWMAFPAMGSHFHPPSVAVISVCLAVAVLLLDRATHRPLLVRRANCSQDT